MAVYAMTIGGREKRVLVKADSQAAAKDRVVSAELLNAEKMAEAMENGETIWREGDPFPADDKQAGDGNDGLLKDGLIDPVGELRKSGEGAK